VIARSKIRKLMDVEDFGDAFTPNQEIAKAKFKQAWPEARRRPLA